MPTPTVEEVTQFINVNKEFFNTPIKDQTGFRRFYEEQQAVDKIGSYSSQLMALLYACRTRIDANSTTPVFYAWKEGNFLPALQHEAVRQFIMDHQNHPALMMWRKNQLLKESGFNDCLTKIKEKAVELETRGHPEAALAANNLFQTLNGAKQEFLSDRKNPQDFVAQCKTAVDDAQTGVLQNHRSIWGNIFQALKTAIKTISFGLINIEPSSTDSIQKTQQMKGALDRFSNDKDEPTPETTPTP